ncbi:MAG: hypothetical protein ACRDRN_13430 [Sciscionella sp.]
MLRNDRVRGAVGSGAVGAELDPLVARFGYLVEEAVPRGLLRVVGDQAPQESGAEPIGSRLPRRASWYWSPSILTPCAGALSGYL